VRALLALVRAELLRLLRSPEVMRFVVLPGAFLVPMSVLMGALATDVVGSGGAASRVAAPRDAPVDLSTPPYASFDVVESADPLAVYDASDAGAAVVSVTRLAGPGDGVRPGGGATLHVVGVAADDDAWDDLQWLVRQAERAEDDALWMLRDEPPPVLSWTVDRFPAQVAGPVVPDTDWELLLAALVLIALVPGPMLLPILSAQERESGVAEQLGVAPPPARARLLARLLGFLLLVGGVGGLLVANVMLPLFLAVPDGMAGFGTAGLEGAARLLAALGLGGAAAMLLGELAPDVSRAMNLGGLVTYAALGLLGGGLAADLDWLPLASLVRAEAGWALALALLGHLVLAGILLEVAAWVHVRNVSVGR
jgi:hypothetical protein